jgi:2-C-methyl-D-erythritol 4-phosphate cytidylyltransferase/2-C-methyl-D-erythritol 2,4-cyclodiphosphate synthase
VADGPAAAILLAAGMGARMSARVPKALVEVGGRSLIRWAVQAVEACEDIAGFVVAIPAEDPAGVAEAGRSPKLLAAVAGGATRQASVWEALQAVPASFGRVVCHDVARPFARPELFAAVLAALEGADGAIPVVPSVDTLKRVDGGRVTETIPRGEVFVAQTPQAFRREALLEAHRRALADGAEGTDDAALLERLGMMVAAVPGDPDNFKVTHAADLRRAEALASARD